MNKIVSVAKINDFFPRNNSGNEKYTLRLPSAKKKMEIQQYLIWELSDKQYTFFARTIFSTQGITTSDIILTRS